MASDEGLKVQFDGQEYAVDDFQGRELVDAERSFGISLFAELDRGSATGIYAMLYLIKRRTNARFTVDDALALNLGEVTRMVAGPGDGEGEAPPSPRAKTGAKK
jgi:hypothetical protein